MIFAQLSVTLTAVKKVSVQEEQMAACTLHCVSISVKPEFSVQGVLALCKFHYCKFHYCGFSNLSRYTFICNYCLFYFVTVIPYIFC